MAATEIDLLTWPRRDTLALFRRFQKPQYSMITRIDVTRILARRAAEAGYSSYLACVHAVGAALHAVPELAVRIRGNKVVAHDRVRLSPTLRFADGRLGFAYLDWQEDAPAFVAAARDAIDAVLSRGALEPGVDGEDDVAFLSCQPWLDFTAVDNPVFSGDDCIPRVTWGRYVEGADGRWTMPVALQVHHGLLDGIHVAQFFAALQSAVERA